MDLSKYAKAIELITADLKEGKIKQEQVTKELIEEYLKKIKQ